MGAKLHYNFVISGHVQGVWFRRSTQQMAQRLGITGFVRNNPDGTVYVEAEGIKENLNRLSEWLHLGPPNANVKSVQSAKGPMVNFSVFEIR